jgi:hypothetical protein
VSVSVFVWANETGLTVIVQGPVPETDGVGAVPKHDEHETVV